jgi:membrane-associated phospholipid phosphatase
MAMRHISPLHLESLKNSLGAARPTKRDCPVSARRTSVSHTASFSPRRFVSYLLAISGFLFTFCFGEGALVAGDLPVPLLAPNPVTSNADFARSEFQTASASPVIAPEQSVLGSVAHSAYEDALLGNEAPAIVLTSAGDPTSAHASDEVIAPTADGGEVTAFESCAANGDLPPIRFVDDAWSFLPRLGHDALGLANWNNAIILGVALGGSLAIRSELDGTVNNWTAEHPDRWGEGSKIIGDFGVAQYQIPVLLGAYVYTVYAQDYYQHDMMTSLISAYTLFGLSTVTVKYIADTNRPSDTWNGGKLGFPSWHDGSMFCMAAVLDDYEGHWIGMPLYAFAGLIGFSRVDTRDHNLSDVVFGGVLGYVIGKSVSGKALYGDSRVHILPYVHPTEGGSGIMLDWSF